MTILLGALLFLLICLAVIAGWLAGGFLIALAWNSVAPIFWAAAPVLQWYHGVAVAFLLSLLGLGRR